MKKFIPLLLAAILIPMMLAGPLTAQDSTYKLLSESSMTITGTSTIHDWEADVETIDLKADFSESFFGNADAISAEGIQQMTVTVPVKSIESGKGGMNSKIYDALKSKKHPTISYSLVKAEVVSTTEEGFTLNTQGELTIAGATKTVSFPVEGVLAGSDKVQFSGSYSLNMKDFDVDPPSAVFGTIKAGEEVTITFDIAIRNTAVATN